MKKLIPILFAAVLVLAMLPLSAAAATERSVTFGSFSGSGSKSYSNNEVSLSADFINSGTIQVEGKYYGASLTAATGITITRVELYISHIYYAGSYINASAGTVSGAVDDGSTVTISQINSNYVKISAGSGATKVGSVTVYYTGHVHTCENPTYTWQQDGDGYICTARGECTGCSEVVEETVSATSKVKTPATGTAMGTTTYTAVFEETCFVTQTKDVVDIPIATLSASDFNFATPSGGSYDGTERAATVITDKETGKITVKYYDAGGNLLTSLPVNAGTYSVKIDVAANENFAAAENLTDSSWTFTIEKAQAYVSANRAFKQYGMPDPDFYATVSGTYGDDKLSYTLFRDGGEDVGKYTIRVDCLTEQENYTVKTVNGEFEIKTATNQVIIGSDCIVTYDGNVHSISAVSNVSEADGTIIYYSTDGGQNWESFCPELTDVGSVTIMVKAENKNYNTATAGYTLAVTPKPVESCYVESFTLNFVENGSELQPKPVVKDGNKVLTEGEDYTLSYADNTSAGTATITITGMGNYGETKEVTFTIVKAEVSAVEGFTEGKANNDAVVTIGEGTVLGLNDFKRVLVDGNELSSDCYTAEEGCIKLTVLKSYLNTLTAGNHTLTVELGGEYDGVTCETTFNVAAPASPKTGDNGNMFLWIAMISVSCAAAVTAGKKRREN